MVEAGHRSAIQAACPCGQNEISRLKRCVAQSHRFQCRIEQAGHKKASDLVPELNKENPLSQGVSTHVPYCGIIGTQLPVSSMLRSEVEAVVVRRLFQTGDRDGLQHHRPRPSCFRKYATRMLTKGSSGSKLRRSAARFSRSASVAASISLRSLATAAARAVTSGGWFRLTMLRRIRAPSARLSIASSSALRLLPTTQRPSERKFRRGW